MYTSQKFISQQHLIKFFFRCSKMGDIYHLVCPCPLAVRTRLLYLSRDFVYRPILAKGELSYQKKVPWKYNLPTMYLHKWRNCIPVWGHVEHAYRNLLRDTSGIMQSLGKQHQFMMGILHSLAVTPFNCNYQHFNH